MNLRHYDMYADNEVYHINVENYKNDHEVVRMSYDTGFNQYFDCYDDYKNFFIEVGSNHPEGVSFRYLTQLMESWVSSKTIENLLKLGVIEEVEMEDGQIGYRAKNVTLP